jgi:magnesium chelatase family protein
MGRAELERHAALERGPMRILVEACRRMGLTARGYDRVRRVARTLADLDSSPSIFECHVAEAVQYRRVVNLETSEPGFRLTAPPLEA